MPVIHWIAETRKWQAFGLGCVGLGDTPDEALAAWLADFRRVQPLAATTGDRNHDSTS